MSSASARQAPSVLQVFFKLHNRGGERVAKDIHDGLRSRGHDVETVAVTRRESDAELTELNHHVLVLDEAGGKQPSTIRGVIRLWRHLAANRPDGLIIHTTASGFIAAPVARLLGIRKRILVHHNPIGTHQTGFWVQLERLYGSIGMYSHIVFVSDTAQTMVSDWPRRYVDRTHAILNSISLPTPEPSLTATSLRQQHGLPEDTILLLSVGSLEPQKNQATIVRAMQHVENAHLFIAGEGTERQTLEALAQTHDAPVTFLGLVDSASISALLHQCDVLLFPSAHEGRALTLLEAAEAGIAIISSDIPENVAVLGNLGEYLDAYEVDGWNNRIHRLVDDPSYIATLRKRTAALQLPTADEMIDQYQALLEKR